MEMTGRYLEDFTVGQTFRSHRLRIDKERIKTFGAEFDPQPFHPDEEAAPVRPGGELRIARSRRGQGLIKVGTTTLNQNDEARSGIIANLVVPRRPTQHGDRSIRSAGVASDR